MCNLYTMTAAVDEMRRVFGPFSGDTANLPPFDEIYPGHRAPVLRRDGQDGLKLEMEKMALAHEQAGFLLSILKLKLEAKKAGMRTQGLAVEEAELAVAEVESQLQLAGLQSELKRNDVDAAELNLSQRAAVSPIEGCLLYTSPSPRD